MAYIVSLNALAIAKVHLGDLDRLKKLLKMTVLSATTEHAPVADGASNLFVQIFGPEIGHVRLVYGVRSLPVGARRQVFHYPGDLLAKFILRAVDGLKRRWFGFLDANDQSGQSWAGQSASLLRHHKASELFSCWFVKRMRF